MNGRSLLILCLGLAVGFSVCLLIVPRDAAPAAADCYNEPCASPPCCNGDVNSDGTINTSDALYLLRYVFEYQPEPVAIACGDTGEGTLPATGQTECYGDSGATDCDTPDFPGQDGFYQAGCPMEGRFVDSEDGTVTDNCTGLMWQQATADTNGDQQITREDRVTCQEALQYCESLEFAGHDDWRLPNVRELLSIVDYGCYGPAMDPAFSAESSWSSPWYWSSSSYVEFPDHAWLVYFDLGNVSNISKSNAYYVRAVRG
jgi:hypothetical protein